MFQEEDRASPIAFTVDFGGEHSKDTEEEKSRKLKRFALRSSQRKAVQSPSKHQETMRKQEDQNNFASNWKDSPRYTKH